MDSFWKLFVLGVAMSFGPCMAICSPLIVPYVAGTERGWRGGLFSTLAFLGGRLVTYSGLGFLAGLGGMTLLSLLSGHRQPVFLGGGALVAAAGLLVITGRLSSGDECCPRGRRPARGPGGAFALGLTTGIMPCAALLAVLGFIALEAAAPWRGGIMGAAFGLGKFVSPLLPLGVAAGAFPRLLPRTPRAARILRVVSGGVLVLAGVYLAARGLY